MKRSASAAIEEVPTLSDFKQEEEHLRIKEEAEIARKRHEAQQLAVRRGLAADQHLQPRALSPSLSSPHSQSQMAAMQNSPLLLQTTSEADAESDAVPSPFPAVDSQTMPDSSSFHVDESDYSSLAPTPNRPLSLKDEPREVSAESNDSGFVPARLPHFDSGPD